MLFEFFGKSYDTREDEQAKNYFKKMKQWISSATERAKIQLKSILEKSKYAAACLLEGSAATFDHRNQLIMESWSGENRKGTLSSATDEKVEEAFGSGKKKKKEKVDHSIDEQVFEVFGESKKKKEGSQTLTLDQQIAEAMQ